MSLRNITFILIFTISEEQNGELEIWRGNLAATSALVEKCLNDDANDKALSDSVANGEINGRIQENNSDIIMEETSVDENPECASNEDTIEEDRKISHPESKSSHSDESTQQELLELKRKFCERLLTQTNAPLPLGLRENCHIRLVVGLPSLDISKY